MEVESCRNLSPDIHTCVLTELHPMTKYYARVRVNHTDYVETLSTTAEALTSPGLYSFISDLGLEAFVHDIRSHDCSFRSRFGAGRG